MKWTHPFSNTAGLLSAPNVHQAPFLPQKISPGGPRSPFLNSLDCIEHFLVWFDFSWDFFSHGKSRFSCRKSSFMPTFTKSWWFLLVLCLMAGPQFAPHQPEKSNFFLCRAGIPFPSPGGFILSSRNSNFSAFSTQNWGWPWVFVGVHKEGTGTKAGFQGRNSSQPFLSSGYLEIPSWLFFHLYSPQRCRKRF